MSDISVTISVIATATSKGKKYRLEQNMTVAFEHLDEMLEGLKRQISAMDVDLNGTHPTDQ